MDQKHITLNEIRRYIRSHGSIYARDEKYIRELCMSIARMPKFLRTAVERYIGSGAIADVEIDGCSLEYLMDKYKGDIIGSALTLYVLYKEPGITDKPKS